MKNVKPRHERPVVFLDAGHYGKYNQSPVVPEYYESEMNWKLQGLLQKELTALGMEVRLVRQDQQVDLNEYYRGTAAEGGDLLLSVHSNAAQRENADYPLVYLPLSGAGRELAEALAKCIRDLMDTVEPGKTASKEGANGDYYGVIRGAAAVGTVALILEHSFHTNRRSTLWLLEDGNLEAMAKAEAQEVARWFGLAEAPELWYRIRKSWDAAESQLAAYKSLEGAIRACPVGYSVFDAGGNAVYTNYAANPANTDSFAVTMTKLQLGSKGLQVRALQQLLIGNGFPCGDAGADGIFGADTEESLMAFQREALLVPSGTTDRSTMEKLLGY